MAHDRIALVTQQAARPSEPLDADEPVGCALRWSWMAEGMAPSYAGASATAAAETRMQRLEPLIRDDYERFHPEDSFDDLKRRAQFSEEDKGVLRDWLALAERRERDRLAAAAIAAE